MNNTNSQPRVKVRRGETEYTTSLRRAISLLTQGRAYIVEVDPETTVRSSTQAMAYPVTITIDPVRLPARYYKNFYREGREASFSKRGVFERDGWRCVYCHAAVVGHGHSNNRATIDHVTPQHMGGATSWENCVCACAKCNSKKGGLSLKDARMRFHDPSFKPTVPSGRIDTGIYRQGR